MKKLLLLLPFVFMLTSCGADPVKYNDAVADYLDKVVEIGENFTNKVNMTEEDSLFTLSNEARKAVKKLNDISVKLNSLDKPKGSYNFHNAAEKYINSVVGYVNITGIEYSRIKGSAQEKEFERIDVKVDSAYNILSKSYEEVLSIQESFAKSKGFQLK